ncbi:MAG TPA: 4-alpha-glucanotransferase, partial [Acetobacteraceae bacterium]|nr:4-alpha-glucanotransferase [Acetobacteraceae bacterium]
MIDESLRELAEEVGIDVEWQSHIGEPRTVSPDALRLVLERLGYPCGNAGEIAESRERVAKSDGIEALPPLLTAVVNRPVRLALPSDPPRRARLMLESGLARDLALRETHNGVELPAIIEPGYHRLLIGSREVVLAVAPERAATLADLASQARMWGLAAQVYGLRRPGDGGVGDAAGIAELAEVAARAGADALALSPMHALFPAQPHRYGPYSPSSRLFLNPLHAAPEMVLGVEGVAHAIRRTGLAQDYARLEARTLIDWPAAAGAKLRLLRDLFAHFRSGTDVPDALRADFTQFEADGGGLLAGHVCFEALQAEQLATDGTRGDWHDWPSDLRDPTSATVAAFAQAHRR